jgi:hypothetical protein
MDLVFREKACFLSISTVRGFFELAAATSVVFFVFISGSFLVVDEPSFGPVDPTWWLMSWSSRGG